MRLMRDNVVRYVADENVTAIARFTALGYKPAPEPQKEVPSEWVDDKQEAPPAPKGGDKE